MVGPEGWRREGDLVQDNIKMNIEELEGFEARTGLIWLRTCTGV